MRSLAILLTCLAVCCIACNNYCNGHGECLENDRCECYLGWGGADCSLRACPYGEAFSDTYIGDLNHNDVIDTTDVKTEWYIQGRREDGWTRAHGYAECSNAGLCNRQTGECKCFPGFEGEDCSRTTCPSSTDSICSGHGICTSAFVDTYSKGDIYYGWEVEKFYSCKCDKGWSGIDCSKRTCYYGVDPSLKIEPVTYEYEVPVGFSHSFTLLFDDIEYSTPIISTRKFNSLCDLNERGASVDYQTEIQSALRKMSPFAQVSVDVIGCGSYDYLNQDNTDKTKFTLNCDANNKVVPVSSYKIRITVDYAEYDKLKTSKLSLILINEDSKFVAIDGIGDLTNPIITCNGQYTIGDDNKIKVGNDSIEVVPPNEELEGEIILSMQQEYKPTECANHGLCNTETGLCECFTQYYGAACEKQRSIQF